MLVGLKDVAFRIGDIEPSILGSNPYVARGIFDERCDILRAGSAAYVWSYGQLPDDARVRIENVCKPASW